MDVGERRGEGERGGLGDLKGSWRERRGENRIGHRAERVSE